MKRVMRWALAMLVAVVVGIGLLGIVGYREATSDPVVRTTRVVLPDWSKGAAPIRIAPLSDIHIGSPSMDAERLARIVAQVNARHPDLILLAGDFVVGHERSDGLRHAPKLVAPLSGLHAPLGVIAVPGNHDHWTAPAAVAQALKEAGITVLANDAAARGPVTIVGIDDAFSGHADAAAAYARAAALPGAKIVLSHAPDIVPALTRFGPHLLLVGHTHCGQIVLPTGRGLIKHSPITGERLYDPHYRCGIVRDDTLTTIVTAGVGSGSTPIRLNAPPDWWLVTVGP